MWRGDVILNEKGRENLCEKVVLNRDLKVKEGVSLISRGRDFLGEGTARAKVGFQKWTRVRGKCR